LAGSLLLGDLYIHDTYFKVRPMKVSIRDLLLVTVIVALALGGGDRPAGERDSQAEKTRGLYSRWTCSELGIHSQGAREDCRESETPWRLQCVYARCYVGLQGLPGAEQDDGSEDENDCRQDVVITIQRETPDSRQMVARCQELRVIFRWPRLAILRHGLKECKRRNRRERKPAENYWFPGKPGNQ